MRASGRLGLGIFLPPAHNNTTTSSLTPTPDVFTLPLVLASAAPPLPENPRSAMLRLIYRYSYALGVSQTRFIMMTSSFQGRKKVRLRLLPPLFLACLRAPLYIHTLPPSPVLRFSSSTLPPALIAFIPS